MKVFVDAMEFTSSDRARLVRYCLSYTGDPDAAEDLVQQTLFEAWRKGDALHSPDVREYWLFGVARNVCRRWLRERSRSTARMQYLDAADDAWVDQADDYDITLELERDELADVLDRALRLLPPETRAALIQRYIEELPQSESARRLGLSEGVIEARLHRGKLALRRLFTTDLLDDAIAHGLVVPDTIAWRQTHMWCPTCGQHKVVGRYTVQGDLQLDCPDCLGVAPSSFVRASPAEFGDVLDGVKGFKPSVSRILRWLHDAYRDGARDQTTPCDGCGREVPIRAKFQDERRYPELWYACNGCGMVSPIVGLPGIALGSPEGLAFWREHGRIRLIPGVSRMQETASPTVAVSFESITGSARRHFLFVRDNLQFVETHATH